MKLFKKNNKYNQGYNTLNGDLRLRKIPLEKAEEIIKTFENKWVYIKHTCYIQTRKTNSDSGVYTKFKVRNININNDYIFLYGFEDKDRLVIAKEELSQSECSDDSDEIKLILREKNILIDIYIKCFLPSTDTRLREIEESRNHLIITEGKTDWKHLKNALVKLKDKGKYQTLDIEFFEYEEDVKMGNKKLQSICSYLSLFDNEKLKIFVFDSDDPKINKEYEGREYINHGNNVYSFILPVPKHRKQTPLISIEHYYQDDEVKLEDMEKRRLYLANEFDSTMGRHYKSKDIYAPDVNKVEPNHIIDDKVFRIEDEINKKEDIFKNNNKINIALSKNNFATNIMNGIKPYDIVTVDTFEIVFDVINNIFNDYYSNMSKKYDENTIEISPGIYLEKINNNFEVLFLHISLPENIAIQVRNATMVQISLKISDDKMNVIFQIYIKNINFEIPIQTSKQLINFLNKKQKNIFNRIELHICNEDKICISRKEILKDDISIVLIDKLLKEYYS